MKMFETSNEIAELCATKWEDTDLDNVINLKIISTPKAKTILKVQRANATTHFLTQKGTCTYRPISFFKAILLEGILSNVSYDSEKDKMLVETDIAKEIFRMRRKFPNYVDILEEAYIVINQIEDEEQERKEAERLAKKDKKK